MQQHPKADNDTAPGIYRHTKSGKWYWVYGDAMSTEPATYFHEERNATVAVPDFTVYRACYPPFKLFARPKDMFHELPGKSGLPRFERKVDRVIQDGNLALSSWLGASVAVNDFAVSVAKELLVRHNLDFTDRPFKTTLGEIMGILGVVPEQLGVQTLAQTIRDTELP